MPETPETDFLPPHIPMTADAAQALAGAPASAASTPATQPPAAAAGGGATAPPAVAAPATDFNKLLGRQEELNQQQLDVLKRRAAEMGTAITGAQRASGDFMRTSQGALDELRKKTQAVPMYKQPEFQAALGNWMTIASLMGAIAGGRSRGSTTAALEAMSGAMNGFATGTLTQLDRSMKQWKLNAEATIQNNQQQMQEYEAVIRNAKTNLDQKMNEVQLIATKYQDEMLYGAAAQKNFTLVSDLMQKRDAMNLRYAEVTAKVDEHRAKILVELAKASQQKFAAFNTPEGLQHLAEILDREAKKPGGDRVAKNIFAFYKLGHPGGAIQTGVEYTPPEKEGEPARQPEDAGGWLQLLKRPGVFTAAPAEAPAAAPAPAAPATPAAPAAPASLGGVPGAVNFSRPPGQQSTGVNDGKTPQTAITLTPGREREEVQALPPGTWFINPADGQPDRRKG